MHQKKLVVREASAIIRGFVWGIPSSIDDDNSPPQFTDGEPACAIELLMLFFNNMSVEFKARIGGFKDNVSRIHHCSENHEHNHMSDTRFVDLLDIDDLMRDFLLETQECSSEEEQEKEFCSVLLHHLVVREKKFPCTYESDCKGMHMQRNTTNYENGNCYQKFERMTVKSKLVLCVSPTVQVTNRDKSVFGGLQHLYLSYMQGKKIAVTPVHTEEEMELYLLLRRNNPSLANQVSLKKHGKISPSYGLSSVMMASLF
ncbi:uncharacterized protein EV154DRAFT_607727 [Mucor mucedo]|uniref:uncharacterized protein n=1 Tax=Mucor mucedo TaxID=29922 RepID=UPI00221E3C26|nr:uncharacterized protein EV154DRAFT_607727 [Mucor mucedo]KAI7869420.1 hypothetical protein EV154DRAFT_607727 [Mucor mucedo]